MTAQSLLRILRLPGTQFEVFNQAVEHGNCLSEFEGCREVVCLKKCYSEARLFGVRNVGVPSLAKIIVKRCLCACGDAIQME